MKAEPTSQKHTPGPWEVVSQAGWPAVYGAGRIICSPGGFSIGQMQADKAKAEQITADARLIAAAPDMLSALKAAEEALGLIISNHQSPGGSISEAQLDWVTAAQSKVAGGIALAEKAEIQP